jgi:hypothetical protein
MTAGEENDVRAIWLGMGDGARVMFVLAEQGDAVAGSVNPAAVVHAGARTSVQRDRETLAAARWLMPSLSPRLVADVLGLDLDPAEIDSDPAEWGVSTPANRRADSPPRGDA